MDASLSQSGNAPASISIQDAPDAIPEVGVSITGGGANISETVGPGTDALVFELSVGREHEVTIDTTNFIGRKSFVLPPGGAQVDVQMLEKLFVPDPQNSRLVQIDDMTGANWQTNTSQSFFDAAVGPDGRIYAVAQGADFQVIALADISDTSAAEGWDGTFDIAQAVAADRDNGYLYIGGGNSLDPFGGLARIDLSDDSVEDLSEAVSDYSFDAKVWGVAVGPTGDVYASGTIGSDAPKPIVRRVNPETLDVLWSVNLDIATGSSDRHVDVAYNAVGLFVTNPQGGPGSKIFRLDPQDGSILDSFGSDPVDENSPKRGEFYGPRRFVAVNRGKLYVLDDGNDGSLSIDNRIVSFGRDLDGTQWETYGSDGTGEDEFNFYLQY